jgi:hypothetical protein
MKTQKIKWDNYGNPVIVEDVESDELVDNKDQKN